MLKSIVMFKNIFQAMYILLLLLTPLCAYSQDDPQSVVSNMVTNLKDKIVFVSKRDDRLQLYAINPDGTGEICISKSAYNEGYADVNPGGRKIAFTSDEHGKSEIYTMNADGTDRTRLTVHDDYDIHPRWSPDGSKIMYMSSHGKDKWDVMIMNADGSDNTLIIENGNTPEWSPDGQQIAFSSDMFGSNEIYIANTDGSNISRLSFTPLVSDTGPVWSSDGQSLLFCQHPYTLDGPLYNKMELYIMAKNGTNTIRLTCNDVEDSNTYWSPDGSRITFNSLIDGHYQVFIMNADGSDVHQITRGNHDNVGPCWVK